MLLCPDATTLANPLAILAPIVENGKLYVYEPISKASGRISVINSWILFKGQAGL